MFNTNGKRIVLHEDIDDLCNRFSTLTDEFNDSLGKITDVLSNITDSYRRSGGKGTVVETCRGLSTNLFSVCETLITGNELLKMSKEQTRNIDAVICDAIRNQEFSELAGFDYYEPTDSHTEVWSSENDYWNSLIGQTTQWDSAWEQAAYGYFCKGQCTWYAFIRFMTLYPAAGLGLGAASGHAKDWLKNNDGREHLDVRYGGWNDLDSSRLPCIAVSEDGEYGHVYIVEGVTRNDDGSIKEIIYSECNGYNREQNVNSSNGVYNEGVDCVYDKATPAALGVSGFIYYAP